MKANMMKGAVDVMNGMLISVIFFHMAEELSTVVTVSKRVSTILKALCGSSTTCRSLVFTFRT